MGLFEALEDLAGGVINAGADIVEGVDDAIHDLFDI
jgi:hypothetical protein